MNKVKAFLPAIGAVALLAFAYMQSGEQTVETEVEEQPAVQAAAPQLTPEAKPPKFMPTSKPVEAKDKLIMTDDMPPMAERQSVRRAPPPPLQPGTNHPTRYGDMTPESEHGHEHHNHERPDIHNGKLPPVGAKQH